MAESTYREGCAALKAFVQNFAAPLVAIIPVLEKITKAEEALQQLTVQVIDQQAALNDAQLALHQAQADRQAVMASIEHERQVQVEDVNRHVAAYRAKVQDEIDQLSAQLHTAQQQTATNLRVLEEQLAVRVQEQRDLDAILHTKQQLLAELSGKIFRAAGTTT